MSLTARIYTTYPVLDASRRLRIEPLAAQLRERGVEVRIHQLMTDKEFATKNDGRAARAATALRMVPRLAGRLARARAGSDIAIVHREALPWLTPMAERLVTRHAGVALLDVDDAIYLQPTYGSDWRRRLRDPSAALTFPQLFGLITCGSPGLQEAFGAGPARVLAYPTCPPPWVWNLEPRTGPGDLGIVWTGSQSTLPSLEAVLPAVLQACEDASMHLTVLGGRNVERLPAHPRLAASRWSEAAERSALAQAAIGIMPIPSSGWEQGKSGYKAILSICAGLDTWVSPVGINENLARTYANAHACPDESWYESLVGAARRIRASGINRSTERRARADFDVQAISGRIAGELISRAEQAAHHGH